MLHPTTHDDTLRVSLTHVHGTSINDHDHLLPTWLWCAGSKWQFNANIHDYATPLFYSNRPQFLITFVPNYSETLDCKIHDQHVRPHA